MFKTCVVDNQKQFEELMLQIYTIEIYLRSTKGVTHVESMISLCIEVIAKKMVTLH